MQDGTPGKFAGALTLDDFGVSPDERRKEARTGTFKSVRVFTLLGKLEPAYLTDCSPHGVAVLVRTRLRHGQEFILKLQLDRLLLVVYRVRYCRRQNDGWHRLGGLLAEIVGARDPHDFESVFRALLEAAQE